MLKRWYNSEIARFKKHPYFWIAVSAILLWDTFRMRESYKHLP